MSIVRLKPAENDTYPRGGSKRKIKGTTAKILKSEGAISSMRL